MCSKVNCWEFRNCGLEPGGVLSEIYGECPVPRLMKEDGINGGVGAGRVCWTVMNACCAGGHPAGRHRRISCLECEFYRRVIREEDLQPPLVEDELSGVPKIRI